MRTGAEIVERIQKHSDRLGFTAEVLAPFLTAEEVLPLCKVDVDLSQWDKQPQVRDAILDEMRDYMTFAWRKAIAHRGISAARSVAKFRAWAWLLGEDVLLAFIEDTSNYPNYGAPVLKRVCEVFGFPLPADEGAMRMARGESCADDCDGGCGR